MTELSVKIQNWGDDLRLPTFMDPAPPIDKDLFTPPVPFQSKHLPALKRGLWYALLRPKDRSRTGMLCILPDIQACVYVPADAFAPSNAHHKPRPPRYALLRLRVDPTFLVPGAGPTIFAATMSPVARRLWVEDVLVWKGRKMYEETFTARWNLVTQWIDHYCLLDTRLLGGLEIEAAAWRPLASVAPTADTVWELQSNDPGKRRLLWIANTRSVDSEPSCIAHEESPAVAPVAEITTVTHSVFATRDAGPDQWCLKKADGTAMGKALIRRLAVSSALRSAKGATVEVEVEWQEDFGKWEIKTVNRE